MARAQFRISVLFQYACFFLSFLLCAYLILSAVSERSDFSPERLYWEYAGRISGATWTPGFSEWVQFRGGPLPAPSAEAIQQAAQPPYTGFTAEYPPGALLYFMGLRLVFDDYASFALAHNMLMAAAFLLSMGLAFVSLRISIVSASRSQALIATSLAALAGPLMIYLIGNFIVSRFDALTAVLSAAAILLAQLRYPALAGALLGLAGAVKLWPLFLLPFLFGTRRAYLLTGLCALTAFAACHLLFLAFGTEPGDLLGYLKYAFDRPIHSESFLATLIYLTEDPTDLVFSFGSWGVAGSGNDPLPGWMQNSYLALMFGIALLRLLVNPAAFGGTAGAAPTDVRHRAMMQLGAIALLMCMSKVFSGEYMVWIVPLALAAAGYAWGLPLVLALIAMTGVKLGYILSGEARYISEGEAAAFVLKWAALLALAILGCIAGLCKRRSFPLDDSDKSMSARH